MQTSKFSRATYSQDPHKPATTLGPDLPSSHLTTNYLPHGPAACCDYHLPLDGSPSAKDHQIIQPLDGGSPQFVLWRPEQTPQETLPCSGESVSRAARKGHLNWSASTSIKSKMEAAVLQNLPLFFNEKPFVVYKDVRLRIKKNLSEEHWSESLFQ